MDEISIFNNEIKQNKLEYLRLILQPVFRPMKEMRDRSI